MRSTSRSGENVDVTSNCVVAAPNTTTAAAKPRKITVYRAMIPLVLFMLSPTSRVAGAELPSTSAGYGMTRHCELRDSL